MKVPMFRGGPKLDKRRPTPHAQWHEGSLPADDGGLHEKEGHFYLSEDHITEFLVLGLQNAHATFGGEVFLQVIGFPQMFTRAQAWPIYIYLCMSLRF